jgi:GT2 family glycosyltransferase
MKVEVVVIAYNQPAWIAKLFETAVSACHDLEFLLFLHSRDPATASQCERIAKRSDVVFHLHGVNRGLSVTWNDGVLGAYENGADAVIVANDDVYFSPGDIDRIAARAAEHPESYIITCAGYHHRLDRILPSHGYSCFAINPVALQRIGCFDENFFPAYCEDQDYCRRAALACLQEENCPDTMVHHGGSCAIYSSPQLRVRNAVSQSLNRAYYFRKWGGDAGSEAFTAPFDQAAFGIRIPPSRRHSPYGTGFDRADREHFLE